MVGGVKRLFDRNAHDFWLASFSFSFYLLLLKIILKSPIQLDYLIDQIHDYGLIPLFILFVSLFGVFVHSYLRVNRLRKTLVVKNNLNHLLRDGDFIIKLEFYYDWCKLSLLFSMVALFLFLVFSVLLILITNLHTGIWYSLYIFSMIIFLFVYSILNVYYVEEMSPEYDSISQEYRIE